MAIVRNKDPMASFNLGLIFRVLSHSDMEGPITGILNKAMCKVLELCEKK